MKALILLIVFLVTLPIYAQPYAPSTVITAVNFDWATYTWTANGSDNWPITWADDDNQYASFGDGGGFGGDNANGRVSLGFAKLSGPATAYAGTNVWGGYNAQNPATFDGKSYGIISIRGTLYAWVSPGSDTSNYASAKIYQSTNHAASWTPASWSFTLSDGIVLPSFLQFGKDHAGARDSYVYSYAINLKNSASLQVQTPGELILMRVPMNLVLDRTQYEFFAGMNGANPTWTSAISLRQPVFADNRGVGWTVSASYNSGIQRYLVTTEHDSSALGKIGIFDAPNPWGPWTTALYASSFGQPFTAGHDFFWNFSNKWLSSDGKSFALVFTGTNGDDVFNLVRGTFTIGGAPPPHGLMLTYVPAAPDASQSISITLSGNCNPTCYPRDWIGLYAVSAGNQTFVDWKYLNNSKAPPVSIISHPATITLNAPSASGSYEFRSFLNDGYTITTKSSAFTLPASHTLQVGPAKPYATPCQAIPVSISGDTLQIDAGSYPAEVCTIP